MSRRIEDIIKDHVFELIWEQTSYITSGYDLKWRSAARRMLRKAYQQIAAIALERFTEYMCPGGDQVWKINFETASWDKHHTWASQDWYRTCDIGACNEHMDWYGQLHYTSKEITNV